MEANVAALLQSFRAGANSARNTELSAIDSDLDCLNATLLSKRDIFMALPH